ncbi:MAG: metal ABC transporter ATP-binding protein [Cytophagaceae bacterium]|jgi:zinc transport system ATP-binding protein|nr:metal ABC transporter ATP-binding protein [Cytophagaceae bacterium]
MNKLLVSVRAVTAGYNVADPVLRDVSLDIFGNDFIGVIGPNGGGKTTLIKIILRIIQPFKGEVAFPSGKITTGYLPQASQIDRNFPITVQDVVFAGIKPKNRWLPTLSKHQKEHAKELLSNAGLADYVRRPIGELSGGQLQRVLLCRALTGNPDLLILDEPSTYVDKNFENDLYEWLKKLNSRMAIVLVSHDIGTIASMVKSIACVNSTLHYHESGEITDELLAIYNCPIDLVAHGTIPHRVLGRHGNVT